MTYDDFSKTPKTITELRASKKDDGTQATPRDALVSLLRDIDEGKTDLATVYICFRANMAGSENKEVGFSRGGAGGWQDDLALLESQRNAIWDWVKEVS